jgi:hypothetical protein
LKTPLSPPFDLALTMKFSDRVYADVIRRANRMRIPTARIIHVLVSLAGTLARHNGLEREFWVAVNAHRQISNLDDLEGRPN